MALPMTGHHDGPRRGADCERPRSVGTPDAAFDAALPILRELERLVHAAATADEAAVADSEAATAGDEAAVAADEAVADGEAAVVAADGASGAGRDHSADPSEAAVSTTTLPSRSVRRSGTPASRTASAVEGAG